MPTAKFPLDGRTVLLVDPAPRQRQMILTMLRAQGGVGHIHEARHARDAVELLSVSKGLLDLIVSAVELPHINGYALVKSVRMARTPGLPDTPAALFHGVVDRRMERLGESLGIGFMFGLPIAGADLCRELARVIVERAPPRPRSHYEAIDTDWDRPAAATAVAAGPAARPGLMARAIEAPMALAADLMGAHGLVLMPAGSTVTPTLMRRLIDNGTLQPDDIVPVVLA